MTPFWIINAALWLALLAYVAWDYWFGAGGRESRHGDPMRLAVAGTAIMMAGFSLRWLLAPQSELLWQALYLFSAINAVWIGWLCYAYGRGPKL